MNPELAQPAADRLRKYLAMWQEISQWDITKGFMFTPRMVAPSIDPEERWRQADEQVLSFMGHEPLLPLLHMVNNLDLEFETRKEHHLMLDTLRRTMRQAVYNLQTHVDGPLYLQLMIWACQADALDFLDEHRMAVRFKGVRVTEIKKAIGHHIDVRGQVNILLRKHKLVFVEWWRP